MSSIRLTIPVTPPSPMGTTIGGHIYVEDPDQSSTPAARMDGTTLMDGSATMQGQWNPIDCGKIPYVSSQQPWIVEFASGKNQKIGHDIRVYVASYSDQIDTPLVRYGLTGATPSYVVTIPGQASKKPQSGSNITPFLVSGITGAVSAAVSVSGKLRRPIGITVDLSGLPTVSPNWGYQLLGFVDGDLTQNPVLATGIITDTTGGLIPAGPDGISIPHTFGPDEPTKITSVTVYAVAGMIASDHYLPGGPPRTPGAFNPNNIVPGITASCVISMGTTTGVVDLTNAMLSSMGAEFFFDPVTGKLRTIGFDLSTTTQLSTQFAWDPTAGVQKIVNLDVGLIKTGRGQVGGPGMVSQWKIFDTVGNLIGWDGDDSISTANPLGSGLVGAWRKRLIIGGATITDTTHQIIADVNGNIAIPGALVVGAVGNANVAAIFNGTVQCSQLAAGVITAAVSLTSPMILVGLNWRGAWVSGFYNVNDVVSYGGYTYRAIVSGSVVPANTAYWTRVLTGVNVVGPTFSLALDPVNGLISEGVSGTGNLIIKGTSITSVGGNDSLAVTPSILFVANSVSREQISVSKSGIAINNLATNQGCSLGPLGFSFVGISTGTTTAFTGTLAAAISAGKNVQGGIIVN